MPFKSKAQRRKFAQLLVEGKISDEQYEEWNRSTGGKELPERVADGRKGGKKRRVAKKSSTKKRPATKRPAKKSSTRKSSARKSSARKSSTARTRSR